MEKVILTRVELYNLVWSEPLSRLALKYNISDNGIRKKCVKMKIPLPKAGHWQKIKHGYKIAKTKLPENFTGKSEIVLCYRNKDGSYIEHDTALSPAKLLKNEILKDSTLPITILDKYSRFEPLVSKAGKMLKKNKCNEWDYVGYYSTHRGYLDISAFKPNIARSLRFMNALIKLLKARKHKVIVDYETYAVVFGEKIKIRLREKSRVEYIQERGESYTRRKQFSTGKLILAADEPSYRQKSWTDTKTPIEDKLVDIIVFLELHAKKEIADRIISEKTWKVDELEQRLSKAIQNLKDAEIKMVKDLIDQANYWKQASIMNEYLTTLEQNHNLDDDRRLWLEWAKQKTAWFDPRTNAADLLLDDTDRDMLIEELNAHRSEYRSTKYW